jgi:hypothetical protein
VLEGLKDYNHGVDVAVEGKLFDGKLIVDHAMIGDYTY